MTKNSRVYLEDILESIKKIDSYGKGIKWREFERNGQVQDAVMRRLEIIGEAVKRVSETTKKVNPAIPWKQISGMCDILIHEYGEIRLERVWKTIQDDLSPLKSGIRAILRKSGKR